MKKLIHVRIFNEFFHLLIYVLLIIGTYLVGVYHDMVRMIGPRRFYVSAHPSQLNLTKVIQDTLEFSFMIIKHQPQFDIDFDIAYVVFSFVIFGIFEILRKN